MRRHFNSRSVVGFTTAIFVAVISTAALSAGPIAEPVPERAIIQTDVAARPMQAVTLNDGDEYPMSADPVVHEVAGMRIVGAYGYNASIPGPVLRVPVGSRITVPFTNNLNEPTTVHWHGLRHDIMFDGVPGVSQEPVQPGETFVYQLDFPDEGVFWYHPHIREDRQQDLGLYGLIIVENREEGRVIAGGEYDREEYLVINDLQPEVDVRTGQRRLLPHGAEHANMAMMGRFGSTIIINGTSQYRGQATAGEIVRYHVLNAASARVYKVAFVGAQTRIVGKDLGSYERPRDVESFLISPAERYTVDVFYDTAGEVQILHDAPIGARYIGAVDVAQGAPSSARWAAAAPPPIEVVDRAKIASARQREPDYVFDLDLAPDMAVHGLHMRSQGGPLYQIAIIDGIEWADDHLAHNAMTTSTNWTWIMRETNQNVQNMDIELSASPGDDIIMRFRNRADSLHPMHHPIHLHGQRFVVLSRDRIPNDNFVWKDTVLVGVGEEVDILIEVDQPGSWMIHCHIPEHMEAGMMSFLHVDTDGQSRLGHSH